MPYNINRYNGTTLVVVEDGTVDNTLDIKLIGRNYAGYGEVQNENMVHLLENFAGTSEPPRKVAGQIWYDSGSRKLKFFDGTRFRTTGGAEIENREPSGLTVGDFWFNSDSNQLYAWSGSGFTLIGPQAVENAGTTELKSEKVLSSDGVEYAVVKAIVNNKTVFIISSAEFTLANDSLIGFTKIKKGITLVDTAITSVSDPNYGVTTTDFSFWGTASNALKLQGQRAADFVLAANPEFKNKVKFSNDGYTLGAQDTLQSYIDGDGNPTFKSSKLDGTINFRTRLSSDLGNNDKIPMKLQGNDILPGVHNISNIGREDLRFKKVFSIDFVGRLEGTADRANYLMVGGSERTGVTGATPNTIAVRDSNGDLVAKIFKGLAELTTNISGGTAGALVYQSSPGNTTFLTKGDVNEILTINTQGQLDWRPITELVNVSDADRIKITEDNVSSATHYVTFVSTTSGYSNLKINSTGLAYTPNNRTLTTSFFSGQATSAAYADLAEKYLADQEYEVGTVVIVGGKKEVTASTFGHRAIGVVSVNPAFRMNDDLEGGTYIALKGRVPVKVIGTVTKGKHLIASNNGCAAQGVYHSSEVFAVALESSDDVGVKLIECVIL
jgi:hypothetical protein